MAAEPTPAPATEAHGVLGAKIKVVTTLGDTVEGELYCYESDSLVIRHRLPSGHMGFKWLRRGVIREIHASGPSRPVSEVLPWLDFWQIEQDAQTSEQEAQRLWQTRSTQARTHTQAQEPGSQATEQEPGSQARTHTQGQDGGQASSDQTAPSADDDKH
mmetsp:Transcript_83930/g.166593  ORF Transcript_83930/g.166593 Transcript_83930/m.166593 type:complete len:159 (-) Transcript_83930:145-621(-)|eukprot:CAMPEP_0172714046 /NCGR_PEP_ID=MMETSP1074-20121228/64559_1 /TAXON_ID=2916 /ORGANISM="Ceratium fusus, Strain PA161109" /LENGTH=158 /DNA_ID=CAMNT_0013538343 /DNA_START=73 /DNA_END=549 /DNA_ORIENTATION=+